MHRYVLRIVSFTLVASKTSDTDLVFVISKQSNDLDYLILFGGDRAWRSAYDVDL